MALLVAAALFQLVTGVLNIARWYAPMPFFFTAGALLDGLAGRRRAAACTSAVKLPVDPAALAGRPRRAAAAGLTRRGLLGRGRRRGRRDHRRHRRADRPAAARACRVLAPRRPGRRAAGPAGQQDRARPAW